MSGAAIINHLLASSGSLTALIGAGKVFTGSIPLNTGLPAISVTKISGVPRKTVAMNEATRFTVERIQVTVEAKTYPSAKAIMTLVRAACPLSRATIKGFNCDSVLPDSDGPDMDDPAAEIYIQSKDFMVRYSGT